MDILTAKRKYKSSSQIFERNFNNNMSPRLPEIFSAPKNRNDFENLILVSINGDDISNCLNFEFFKT